jgi:hypothetical protein
MVEEVESYAGYDYPERPRALVWEGRRLEVSEILSQTRQPQGNWFRVRTGDDRIFELFYDRAEDNWRVEEM